MTSNNPDEFDPEGQRLPVKIDTASNGEYFPQALTSEERLANQLAFERCSNSARKLNISRRSFLKSACGTAATLLAFNEAHAANSDHVGGHFSLPEESGTDIAAAEQALQGDEFIMDMQTHCVDPSGAWATGKDGELWKRNLMQLFGQADKCGDGSFDCYSAQQLVKEVFLDSDTDVGVVSALWGASGSNPTPIEYATEVQSVVYAMGNRNQVLVHGGVLPNEPGAIDYMEVMAKEFHVDAWKMYPQWGPDGVGFFMDDEKYGIPMLEQARALDIRIVCAHRGVPLPGLEYKYSHPGDIVRAARLFPDVTFICYHSGFEPGYKEGPFDKDNDRGIDRLLAAYIDAGFKPNQGNVYAEMGSLWRHYMSKPDQAAHVMGKLLKVFGDERICWGTDSIWYGSPQDQIQAFRSFEITDEFRERFHYPAITKSAKSKIFGLNAARIHNVETASMLAFVNSEGTGKQRRIYREQPNPSFQTFGPRTRREFLRLFKSRDGLPG